MSTRRAWLTTAMLLLPVGAGAHTHKADAAVSPFTSYVNESTLLGPQASVAFTLHSAPDSDKDRHPWSMVLDVGSHFLVDDETEWTVMVGGRGSMHAVGDGMFFGQFLAGYTRTGDGDKRVNAFGIMPGIGLDFMLWNHTGIRVQADYVVPLSGGDSYPRISLGLVYHWPLKK